MKILILFFLFVINSFAYDDSFIDIFNKYKYTENTKLLLNTKKITSKECNKSSCNNVSEYPINTLFISSNYDEYYQIKYNEWISQNNIKEIKIYSENDYLNKIKMNYNLKYILYNGELLDKFNNLIKFETPVVLSILNDVIISDINSINNIKYNKFSIIKTFSFDELINIDTTNIKFINFRKDLIIQNKNENFKNFLNHE